MTFFRQTNRRASLLWSLLLILSLLFSQDVVLHAHDLDSGYDEHLNHSHTSKGTSDHDYLSKIHSASDLSHSEYHDNILYEVDTSLDGALKNISSTLLALAIFILPFGLINLSLLRQVIYHHRERKLIFYDYYVLSPPLRAPPLR
ncbi:MAG TPA: hypothetical protein ENJ07_02440 [Gammaproteobacteria bacterium]|nr:hypothetical protein [Gammaproteobacteria bacterium]